jgi:chemotaxis protein methyltransferase CheR
VGISIEQLLARKLGYALRPRDRAALERFLLARQEVLGRGETSYLMALEDESAPEWMLLIAALVNPETYFFRDPLQLDALRDQVLPACIARREKSRMLRLWSAGCSTGEEAYTLAILCHEALERAGHDPALWNIEVLGTDLNPSALKVAGRGVYTGRTLRQMEAARRGRWLSGPQVVPMLQRQVRFAALNLVQTGRFLGLAGERDVILCRNVFLYLLPERVREIVSGFAQVLTPGGFLLCGHTELSESPELTRRALPGSLAFQKPVPRSPVVPTAVRSAPVRATQESAQALADRGEYTEALALCDALLAQSPHDPAVFALKATIRELLGQESEALALWKKVLALSPKNVLAHVALGTLYRCQGDILSMRRHWSAAEDILQAMSPDTPLEPGSTLTVAALQNHLYELQEAERNPDHGG